MPGGFGHASGMLKAELMIPAGRGYWFPLNGKQTGRPYGRKNFWNRFLDLGHERREILSRNTNWKDEGAMQAKQKQMPRWFSFLGRPGKKESLKNSERRLQQKKGFYFEN